MDFDGVATRGTGSISDGSITTSCSAGWDADGVAGVGASCATEDGSTSAEVIAVVGVETGGSEASLGLIRLSMMRAK